MSRLGLFLPRLSDYGGAEGFALRLAAALAGDGHAVDFVCARKEAEAPDGVRARLVGRPLLPRSAKIAWYAAMAERVRRREKYDLTISLGKTLRQDLLRMSGGPLDVFWRLSERAYGAGLARAWKAARRRAAPANALIRAIERRTLENSRVIVAVSHRVRDWLLEAHPWLAGRDIRVIYNRPDLARFTPPTPEARRAARAAWGLDRGQTALCLAGTNFALKGVDQMIAALALLPPEFVLLVAGGRKPGRFASRAESLGLARRVRFLGRVEDMPSLYAASDVFVLPTFYDTCSNAALEALAAGCKVITSRDNGASFFLPERWVLADPADVQTLAETVAAASAEPPPPPFAWPADVPSGVEPYLALVREMLG
ncbi:MAG: glycosyltransferase family 4 protein [Thermodesulfobacteriota bacterium]